MTVRLSDLEHDELIVCGDDILYKQGAIALVKRGLQEPMFTLKGYVQIDIDYEEER
ncbi:hypothetical protein [Paenibacillus larvae]|uniref:hypothetical protein n=1 Tax=Paenibacillus larvae TaxID=1464 RepID=UPI000CE96DD5|nr:hypothetical protein [Paenibacillus larvae]AVG13000.1 hypothetical protein ERICII_02646 [Paenibacillus larvae subsp. larvae DSM 25430]MDR5569005.1 hypothetical protein [Paenibacillus larvae]MDR5596720.1 hypothetical protein [Paenibacillus larvae]